MISVSAGEGPARRVLAAGEGSGEDAGGVGKLINDLGQAAKDISVFGKSPDNWTVDRIRDRLAQVVGGEWGDDPDAHNEGAEIPVIRVADIRGLDVTCEDLTVRRVKQSKLAGRLIGPRTLLIEKSGGGEQKPVGRTVLGRNLTFDAICSNFMAKTDCQDSLSPTFAAYLLDSAYCSGINTAHIQQTTGIQNLRVSDYLNTKAAIPTVSEQERIAAYLDASCAAIDAAVAAKRRQIEILDRLRKSTITRAMVRGLDPGVQLKASGQHWLGDIPAHWNAPCVKRLLTEPLNYGLNEATELEDRELPRYLRITDFDESGALRDDTFRSLPRDIAREALLAPNDVLFARSGATVGKTFMFRDYEGETCFAGYLIRARTAPWMLSPLFLYLYTKTAAYEAWKNLIFTQATIQNISAVKYNYLVIPLPPVAEQRAICDYVEQRNAAFAELTASISRQIDTLIAYRKSLIHECVTGQRRVTEADLTRAQAHG